MEWNVVLVKANISPLSEGITIIYTMILFYVYVFM